jgi:hypothetical protein
MTPEVGKPPKPFRTDGCTLSRDFNFRQCCEAHDLHYWRGGTRAQRKEADIAFRDCIRDSGHPYLAEIYYLAVRATASPYVPVPWRWGFGWPWPRGYEW